MNRWIKLSVHAIVGGGTVSYCARSKRKVHLLQLISVAVQVSLSRQVYRIRLALSKRWKVNVSVARQG